VSILRARRLTVVAGLLTAMAFAVPGAAQAAPADRISLEVSDVVVATGSTVTGGVVRLLNDDDGETGLTNLRVVIDASGLAGTATVEAPRPADGGKCTTAGARTTCTFETFGVWVYEIPVFFDLKAAPGAAAGASGSYTVTAEADGLSRRATGTVTVAEGVNLVAGPELTMPGKPGSTLALAPTVRNAGSKVVHGVVLTSSTGSRSASYVPQYSNCVYAEVEFYCVFDEDLATGKQYAPASGVAVRLRGDAPAPSSFDTYADWQTPEDNARYMAAIRSRGGKPGTGAALKLVEKPAAALRVPQTDVSAVDNFTHVVVNVTGENLPDLTALDTVVRGKAGETVSATVAIKNLGPAVIDDDYPSAYVKLPAGLTVAEADRNCVPVEGKTGEYRCLTFGMAVGQTVTWTLKVTIGDSATGTGSVTARTEVIGEDGFGPDADATNDTARFLVNPPAGEGGAGGGTGGGGGDSGGLPITGTNTALALGAGVALLLAGTAAVVVARRRRTRYVA
jgi:LPXTG-motif cell wall-anchored protein